MPSSPTAPIAEQGWRDHHGADRPVDPDTVVHVRFRSGGERGPYPARNWRWRGWTNPIRETAHDIIAWRLA